MLKRAKPMSFSIFPVCGFFSRPRDKTALEASKVAKTAAQQKAASDRRENLAVARKKKADAARAKKAEALEAEEADEG